MEAICSIDFVVNKKGVMSCKGELTNQVAQIPFDWSQVDPQMLSLLFMGGCFMAIPAYAAAFGGRALVNAIK
jgi:hypothetical protein